MRQTLQQNLQSWMRRIDQVHFVGIGGVGMGGIAEVLILSLIHI